MPTDVVMPQMGESIFEGTITKWLKKAGDAVEKDEPLFEISTDKVDAEIPAPVAGILAEIRVLEGETVQVNTVVACIAQAATHSKPSGPITGSLVDPPPPEDEDGPPTPPKPTIASTRTTTMSLVDPPPPEDEDGPPTPPKPTIASTRITTMSRVDPPPPEDEDGPPTPPKPTIDATLTPPKGGVNVVMPQMGESIFEGTITKWLKKTGDAVQKDEPLFEISTDKVDAEIPAPIAGVLTDIRVHEGETVQINTVVAVIGGEKAQAQPDGAPAKDTPTKSGPGLEARAAAAPSPASVQGPAPDATPEPAFVSTEKLRSSPLVRRIARENNLDLRRIHGTGSNGRITKEDVLSYMQKGASAPTADRIPAKPGTVTPASVVSPQMQRTPAPALQGKVEPLSRMRSIIAQRMVESRQTAPHAYSIYKVDMTRIVRLRERNRAEFEKRHGVKLTYMPFIAAAAVDALRRFPIVNAALAENSIRYHDNIHLGIAVALEWGLIVPVVREAERRNFVDLAKTMADLAERARTKKLKPEEASGSTFTLTNSGVFGGEYGTPIINQPESAILAIGGLKKEPVVLTDAEGNDTIAIRSTQTYCLGFDHRLIDGADAGKFMTAFKDALENWNQDVI